MSAREAMRQLGIDRFALQIHDASFPSDPDEDWGRGSPYSQGAERFFQFAARLGFDAIQLGPQGMTPKGCPSPYEGTLFSRNPLNLPLGRYVQQGRLSSKTISSIRVVQTDPISPYSIVYDRFQTALSEILAHADASDRDQTRHFLAENESWLVTDALYEILSREHGSEVWSEWNLTPQGRQDQRLIVAARTGDTAAAKRFGTLRKQFDQEINDFALVQCLLHQEHRKLRSTLKSLGLTLLGDLQIGITPRDTWAWQDLFLAGYAMGAPPSRTNPDGQPWGYAVFDPAQIGTRTHPGPVRTFLRDWLGKFFSEFDGVRIDHPHGWIDPWIYRTDDPDPFHAVQHGARLRSSPNEPEHPGLATFSIARAEQVDLSQPSHFDARVYDLDESQIADYSQLFDIIVEGARRSDGTSATIACEVLSTLPYPVQCVLNRHGLGRFRVTQKANLDDPLDVYRVENATPRDWVMLGTHDTPTIWSLADEWCQGPRGRQWGDYLSALLTSETTADDVSARISTSPGELVHSLFTAVLASQARQFLVFFPDLMGLTDCYNRPGIATESNWRLRLPQDFESDYRERINRGQALDIDRCLRHACQLRNMAASPVSDMGSRSSNLRDCSP